MIKRVFYLASGAVCGAISCVCGIGAIEYKGPIRPIAVTISVATGLAALELTKKALTST